MAWAGREIEEFVKQLGSSERAVRLAGLDSLGLFADGFEGAGPAAPPPVLQAVLGATFDSDQEVAEKAVWALGCFNGVVPDSMKAPVVERLLALVKDPGEKVLESACWALECHGELIPAKNRTDVLHRLFILAAREHTKTVVTALRTIEGIGFVAEAEEVADHLLPLTRDARPEVRARAARAFGRYKFWVPEHRRVEVVESLMVLSNDPDEHVRASFMSALEWGSDPHLTLFSHYAPFAEAIPPGLHRRVVEAFLGATHDESIFNQRGAAFDLGNVCYRLRDAFERGVVERLLELAVSSDEGLRHNAKLSLQKVWDLTPPHSRTAVRRVIGRM